MSNNFNALIKKKKVDSEANKFLGGPKKKYRLYTKS